MDPEATLQNAEGAITSGDHSGAVQSITDYYRWRIKGGFEPRNGDTRAETLSARLADALEIP